LPPVSALFFVRAHGAQAQSSGGFTVQVVALAKKAKVSHQHITLEHQARISNSGESKQLKMMRRNGVFEREALNEISDDDR
jgi:hypothetical protein